MAGPPVNLTIDMTQLASLISEHAKSNKKGHGLARLYSVMCGEWDDYAGKAKEFALETNCAFLDLQRVWHGLEAEIQRAQDYHGGMHLHKGTVEARVANYFADLDPEAMRSQHFDRFDAVCANFDSPHFSGQSRI